MKLNIFTIKTLKLCIVVLLIIFLSYLLFRNLYTYYENMTDDEKKEKIQGILNESTDNIFDSVQSAIETETAEAASIWENIKNDYDNTIENIDSLEPALSGDDLQKILNKKEEYKSKLMSTAAVEKESGNSKSIPTTIYLNKDKDKIRSIINSYL